MTDPFNHQGVRERERHADETNRWDEVLSERPTLSVRRGKVVGLRSARQK